MWWPSDSAWSRTRGSRSCSRLWPHVVLFWHLGAASFWDPDEAHYAETSQEMVATSDWWAPHYNEQPFFDKPALFHQLQAIAMVAFGPTRIRGPHCSGARRAWFGARDGLVRVCHAGADTGIVAGLLLVAKPGVFGLARYAILDTLFTLFLFGGAALVSVAALCDRRQLQWPGYAAIAVAVTWQVARAGPVRPGFWPGHRVVGRAAAAAHGLRWLAGLALVVLLSSPWFVYMSGDLATRSCRARAR